MRRLVAVLVVVVSLAGLLLASPASADPSTTVRQTQQRLNALGCDAGPADGRRGRHTETAIVRFQTRVGHRATGRLTAGERRLLHAASAPRCDIRPVPAGTGAGRRIVVSQKQNWVWLIGSAGRVLAQAGTVDNPGVLEKGRWYTGSYCGRPSRVKLNSSGSLRMQNFVRFAPCGIGFHRIPTRGATGPQIHPDWYLGTNLAGNSHGCIRVSKAMSQRIWDFTSGRRTLVVVR